MQDSDNKNVKKEEKKQALKNFTESGVFLVSII